MTKLKFLLKGEYFQSSRLYVLSSTENVMDYEDIKKKKKKLFFNLKCTSKL